MATNLRLNYSSISYSYSCRVRKTEQRRKRGVFFAPHDAHGAMTIELAPLSILNKVHLLCLKPLRRLNPQRLTYQC